MGSNSENNFRRIREEYETKALTAERAADLRREELHQRIPGLRELDTEMGQTGLCLMQAFISGGEETGDRVVRIRERNTALQLRRRELLEKYGYPEDYTDPRYECELCSDVGYVDGVMCNCMKQRLIMANCESSGMGQLLREQNFSNFSLDYYTGSPSELDTMESNLRTAYDFAAGFSSTGSGSLLLYGGTGLGKTHLSSAVAREVIERGFDVCYTGTQGLISDYERERFGNSSMVGGGERLERYFDCDLLILDDLGTEVTNQFTVSCLFNVINTRLNLHRSTIINTNLDGKELRGRYTDRITSRLLGEYRLLHFVGRDVRAQKLGKNYNK